MAYPVGHPTSIIGPQLHNRNVTEFEGLIRCTVVPPRSLYLPLLPSRIGGKLMFVLCFTCAMNKQQTVCKHTRRQRSIKGTWVSIEIQRAQELGYEVMRIHEVWHYPQTTKYDHDSGTGGIFAGYMNTFIGQKLEASGFPPGVVTSEEKKDYVRRVKEVEGVQLNIDNIKPNPGARAVAKLCLNNLWGKLAQRSNLTKKEFIREPREFFRIMTSEAYEVTDSYLVNEECVYVSYKHANGYEEPSPHTSPIIASYVTAHARLLLYSYLEKLNTRVLYYDTDSIIYKSSLGEYEPELSNHLGSMSDELGGEYITEFVSNGAKTYAYKTNGGRQVVKCKGFTLNKLASDQITFDVMKDMATRDDHITLTVNQGNIIRRQTKRLRIYTEAEERVYQRTFDKRVRRPDHTSTPYGYIEPW